MLNKIKISFLIILVAFFLGACSFTFPWEKPRVNTIELGSPNTEETTVSTTINTVSEWTNDLRRFANEEGIKTFLSQAPTGGGATVSGLMADSNFGLGNDVVSLSPADWQSLGFSKPDIIKVDGNYVYALVKNSLHIISLSPIDDAKIVYTLNFNSRPLEILVNSGKLVVLGRDTEINSSALYRTFKRDSVYTFVSIFDVAMPSNPKEVRKISFEGSYLGARLAGGYVYFVSANPAYFLEGEQILPRAIEGGKIINENNCDNNQDCLTSDVYYFDSPYRNYTFLSVATISTINKSEPLNTQNYIIDVNYTYSISNTGNFYLMRTESLSVYDLEQEIRRDKMVPKLSSVNQERIKEIEDSPAFVLRSGEKQIKIAAIVDHHIQSLSKDERDELQKQVEEAFLSKVKQRSKDIDKTTIYRFSFRAGKMEYQAKGNIQGQIIKKGSLDEKRGNLRLVTTRSHIWSLLFEDNKKYYSNVYILDNKLSILGSLENIATDSEVYSTFFMGERVYILTSDILAPMYAVGLSDVSKPTILGGIKIPRYVHVYPADNQGEKFFGLGREELTGLNSQEVKALRVSLFNFADLKQPKELSSYDIVDSTSDSIAFSDYKALSYFISQNVVSLPLSLSDETGRLGFVGVAVLGIEGENLKLRGQIDHSDNGHPAQNDFWNGFSYYDNTVKRSFIVNNNILTFSNKYLKINDLNALSPLKSIKLLSSGEYYGSWSNDFSNDNNNEVETGEAEQIVNQNEEPPAETPIYEDELNNEQQPNNEEGAPNDQEELSENLE